MTETPDPVDALRLTEDRNAPILKFGSVDVSHAVRNGRTHEALNSRSTADVEVDLDFVAGQPIDYQSVVTFGRYGSGDEVIHFTGNVLAASAYGGRLRVEAETAPELVEQQLGHLESRNAIGPELMHLLVTSAGFPEDRINIEGLDEMLPMEAIEVVVPVYGIQVEHPVDLGPLRLVPDASQALVPFENSEAAAEFGAADGYMVGLVVAERMLDAERAILAQADDVLAWLTVRARYGLALLPDGRPQEYLRAVARARPTRGDLVIVRGMASGRSWFRAIKGHDHVVELDLDLTDPSWKAPPRDYSLANRQALLACARAGHAADPLDRIQAIWEAIEFYVAGIRPAVRFDPSEVKKLKKAISKDVDAELRARAFDLLAKINDPPLMAKLREAVSRDGAPVAEGEFELLGRLRKARNDAVHGRTPEIPLREDVDHAVSIVARLLVYRLARRRQQHDQPTRTDA